MVAIDYFFIVVVILCAVICTAKGFVDSFFDKAAPVLSVIAAVFLHGSFSGLFAGFIKNHVICSVVSFLAVFIVAFLIIKVLQHSIGKIFEGKILGSLNRTVGFAFGLVEGIAIVSIVLFLLAAQPFFDASKLLKGSFFFSIFRKILGERFIPSWEKAPEAVAYLGSVLFRL